MGIPEGIAAAKAAFDVSKVALDLVRYPKPDTEAVRARLIEMQDLMLSAQRALGEAEEENRKLRTALDERARLEEFGKQFTFEEGVYWFRDYPYCPNCWDVDRKPMRLDGPFWHSFVGEGCREWNCLIHKSSHNTRERAPWA